MTSRRTAGLAATVSAVILLAAGTLVALPLSLFLFSEQAAADCAALPVPPVNPGTSPAPGGVDAWDGRQVRNAAVIVSVGKARGVPPRGYVIALATAMQESQLLNLANANVPRSLRLPHEGKPGRDHDSVGLFQQRPLPPDGKGIWGTVEELMTPRISAGKFYSALVKVDGWERKRLTDAAQAVQQSGAPEAYQKWEAPAEKLAAHVLGLPNIDVIGGGSPEAPCGPASFPSIPVGPGGWVKPVAAPVTSGYGPRDGHFHAGVDLARAGVRGAPIHAAATGTVTTARCDEGNCNVDGSQHAPGCGWYVDIRHAGNVVTRYCHMLRRPFVTQGQVVAAGQPIGVVGNSGNSSGPHLHYEIHVNVAPGGAATNATSTDPQPFMRAAGAPLG